MPTMRSLRFPVLALAALLTLAACQSDDERAEEHYQRALALLAEGDTARASVEFRNVFQQNGQHRGARSAYAAMLREAGQTRQAYAQYLRLVEQYPDDAEGRIALSLLALEVQDWQEAERHGRRAIELAPDDPAVPVIAVNLDYFDATEAEDPTARRAAFDRAAALLEADPDNLLLLRLQVDNTLRDGDLEAGLAALDTVLAVEPDNRALQDTRLALLAELGRETAIETQLLAMRELFPADEELPAMLLRYYRARGEIGQAADFLRAEAAAAMAAEPPDTAAVRDALSALVQLRLDAEGPEAALAELDRILAETPEGTAVFRALRAAIRFDEGETGPAIAEMQALLAEEISLVEQSQIRVGLARMLLATGDTDSARAQIDTLLEADPTETEALKMRAAWLIEEDEADRAISMLRTALDTNPDDPQALTLMAEAHGRNGNHGLAQEFYALAVEASNAAPAETLRYTALLIEDGRYLPAEELLIDALRLAPGHPELTVTLGELYIRMEDWPRAEGVEASLRETGDASRDRMADSLLAARLAAQDRISDAIGFIETLAEESGVADIRAQIAVVRARLASGDPEGARAFVARLVAEAPDEPGYRFAEAAVLSAVGDLEAAEAAFRTLTEDFPESEQAWIGLIRVLNGQGRTDEAETVLAAALAELPEALELLWAQASFRERAGDYEGAIGIYELMYDRAPNVPVIANNLASLLATYREDDESLDRAWAVARRLRGSELPPFQDTYGWIAYRRGDYATALEYLEPAAAALSTDPVVQYHLGMTYLALGRDAEAKAQLERALQIAGPDDPRPQFARAAAEIAAIEASE